MNSRTQKIMQLATKCMTDREEQNNSFRNLSEDSDDSVKDRDFVLSDSGEDSDLGSSSSSSSSGNEIIESTTYSEEDNLPLAIIRERNTKKEIKEILDFIIDAVSKNLDGAIYTKKGTIRKRRKYDTSPATRKKMRLNIKRQKYSSIKENCGEKCKKSALQKSVCNDSRRLTRNIGI